MLSEKARLRLAQRLELQRGCSTKLLDSTKLQNFLATTLLDSTKLQNFFLQNFLILQNFFLIVLDSTKLLSVVLVGNRTQVQICHHLDICSDPGKTRPVPPAHPSTTPLCLFTILVLQTPF